MSWDPHENRSPAASFSLTSSDLREGEKLAMPQACVTRSPRGSWSTSAGLAPSIRDSSTEMCGRRFTPINRPIGARAPADRASGSDL
jgi:hypothetical protein